MKSLEIVNALLATMKIADNIDLTDCEEHFEKIKQDLEVLEIIRKKRVNVGDLVHVFRVCDADEKGLEFYNAYIKDETKLTLEELIKIKQWLEER